MISIKPADNGWIVTTEWPFNDDDPPTMEVIEHREDEERAEAFARLLWHIAEELSERGSRYDACRIAIGTAPGDKYIDAIEGPF